MTISIEVNTGKVDSFVAQVTDAFVKLGVGDLSEEKQGQVADMITGSLATCKDLWIK